MRLNSPTAFSNWIHQQKLGVKKMMKMKIPTALKTVTPTEKIFQCLLSLVFGTLCSVPKVSNLCTKLLEAEKI